MSVAAGALACFVVYNNQYIDYNGLKLRRIINMLEFGLSTVSEVSTELCSRLRSHRLSLNLKQEDLAARAGVSVGTVRNMEGKGQASIETFLRVVMALGLVSELNSLFVLRPASIQQMEAASLQRKRAS